MIGTCLNLKRAIFYFTLLITTFFGQNDILYYAHPSDESWRKDVETMLSEFLSCATPIDDLSPCNVFLAKALKRVYNINDFDKHGTVGNAMSANEIADYAALSSNWTLLGNATSQDVLDQAQEYVNQGKAVIAVFRTEPHGHVALILPGTQSASGGWGLRVPNSASFFLKRPKSSYVGKGLSYAFSSPTDVKIYGRNF